MIIVYQNNQETSFEKVKRCMPVKFYDDLNCLHKYATQHGWEVFFHDTNTYMVSWRKNKQRINVYLSKMTFVTAIDHPRQGKTQLYRRQIRDEDLIEKIFKNPRVHTTSGYKLKKNRR